ncbi:MAG: DUF2924 domain-containing protein [Gammaproteobacteria bacterium]
METMKDDKPIPLPTLEELKISTVAELRDIFEQTFHVPLQQRVSLDFIKGNLAWYIQAKAQHKDPIKLREKLVKQVTRTQPKQKVPYQPGTRLVREWQGDTYEVTVMEKEFHFQGRHYKSLTAIAHDITGTKWSGPRFFGLKGT